MGGDPVHIPPCRSRGYALAVLPGHTRSGLLEKQNKNLLAKRKRPGSLRNPGLSKELTEVRLHVFQSRMPSRKTTRKDDPCHWLAQAVLAGEAVGHEGLLGWRVEQNEFAFFEAVDQL